MVKNGSILIIAANERSRLDIFRKYPAEYIFKGKTNIREGIESKSSENSIVVLNVPIEMTMTDLKEMTDEVKLQTTQIIRLKDRNKKETRSVKITLCNKDDMNYILDNNLKLGYLSFVVKKFEDNKPRIMRCFRCQKFNHFAIACPNSLTCLRCSGNHRHTNCPNTVLKCANCDGPHATVDPSCPAYKKELGQLEPKGPSNNRIFTPRNRQTPTGRYTKTAIYHNRNASTPRPPPNKWNQPLSNIVPHKPTGTLKSSFETEPEMLMAFLALGYITSPKQMANTEAFMENIHKVESSFNINFNKDKLRSAIECVQQLVISSC